MCVCVPFKSNKSPLEKCHLVRQLPRILHGRRHGPSTKTDLDEKSQQWYLTLWLFNIAMEAMAHRNRWFTY